MHSITICVGRLLTLAAEPAPTQLSRFYQVSTFDVKRVTLHTWPSPSLCNNGRGLGTRLWPPAVEKAKGFAKNWVSSSTQLTYIDWQCLHLGQVEDSHICAGVF